MSLASKFEFYHPNAWWYSVFSFVIRLLQTAAITFFETAKAQAAFGTLVCMLSLAVHIQTMPYFAYSDHLVAIAATLCAFLWMYTMLLLSTEVLISFPGALIGMSLVVSAVGVVLLIAYYAFRHVSARFADERRDEELTSPMHDPPPEQPPGIELTSPQPPGMVLTSPRPRPRDTTEAEGGAEPARRRARSKSCSASLASRDATMLALREASEDLGCPSEPAISLADFPSDRLSFVAGSNPLHADGAEEEKHDAPSPTVAADSEERRFDDGHGPFTLAEFHAFDGSPDEARAQWDDSAADDAACRAGEAAAF